MKIEVRPIPVQEFATELVAVTLWEGDRPLSAVAAAVDGALDGALAQIVQAGDHSGRLEQTVTLYTLGRLPARRVLAVGLGTRASASADTLRTAAAAVARAARTLHATRYALALPTGEGIAVSAQEIAQAMAEGSLLGAYAFDEHKTDTSRLEPRIEAVDLLSSPDEEEDVRTGAARGQIVAEATCLARDLVNRPANYLTPMLLAETAEALAQEAGLRYEVLDEAQMAALGMGALLGVAQGSDEPARLIILEHNADRDDLDTYVVVGKGITFDSGGISLKPGEGMEAMKGDMSGAAAALGVLQAAARLEIPLRVVGLIPATENLPSGRAYKPGDVLESLSGLTIEVISTDAEGRLILADALTFARRYEPRAVVDLATLTGACVTALGHVTSGLMSNNDGLAAALLRASQRSGEKIWRLPLFEEYAEQIKSDVADIKNTGGRPAGAITAGHFLARFAQDYPWAHLDIAGTAWSDKAHGYTPKGATGHGVRLLVQWLRDESRG